MLRFAKLNISSLKNAMARKREGAQKPVPKETMRALGSIGVAAFLTAITTAITVGFSGARPDFFGPQSYRAAMTAAEIFKFITTNAIFWASATAAWNALGGSGGWWDSEKHRHDVEFDDGDDADKIRE